MQGTIPRHRIRDTALYPPLMGVREKSGKLFSRSLKNVAADELGISIQTGEHDPVQDARAALYLYHKHRCALQWLLQRTVSSGASTPMHPLARGDCVPDSDQASADLYGSGAVPVWRKCAQRAVEFCSPRRLPCLHDDCLYVKLWSSGVWKCNREGLLYTCLLYTSDAADE